MARGEERNMKLTIRGLTGEMEGVASLEDGMTVFVSGALPGEVVEARIVKKEKRFARAEIVKILCPSGERRSPFCPHFGTCGGCAGQHMEYGATLTAKRQGVQDALRRIGGADIEAEDAVGMDRPMAFRNKAEFAVGSDMIGFLAQGSRRIVPAADCPLQRKEANRAAAALLEWRKKHPSADVRHLVTRVNRRGQLAATVTGYGGEEWKGLAEHMREALPEMISLHRVRLNGRPAHALDGRIGKMWGEDYIYETLLGVEYAISPLSFFQVNPEQAEKLYSLTVEMADLKNGETCLDAYCGVGAITLQLAKTGARVLGVEVIGDAVKNARDNARHNGIAAQFMTADAPEALYRMREGGERLDALVVDPPRAGLSEAFVEAALAAGPGRIVYVSCNPGTLARDIKRMAGEYRVERAVPVDMFPWTGHVETVVLMSRIDR